MTSEFYSNDFFHILKYSLKPERSKKFEKDNQILMKLGRIPPKDH